MVITNVQVTIQKRPEEAGTKQKTFTFTGEGYTVSPADTVMYPRDLRLMDMLNETIKKYNGEIRRPQDYASGSTTGGAKPVAAPPTSSNVAAFPVSAYPVGLPVPTTFPAHINTKGEGTY